MIIFLSLSPGIAWLISKYGDGVYRTILMASLKLQQNNLYSYRKPFSQGIHNQKHINNTSPALLTPLVL